MKASKIVYTAIFIVLGIVLPQAFHMIGGAGIGSVLLPMHIPVLVGAIILGPVSGVIIGITSVLVGFMLGMPTLPMAAFMLFELATYGLVAGYLGNNKQLNVYVSLIGAMLAGRLVSLITMNIAIGLFGMDLPPIFGTIMLYSAGIPGAITHIIVVPVLVFALRKNNGRMNDAI